MNFLKNLRGKEETEEKEKEKEKEVVLKDSKLCKNLYFILSFLLFFFSLAMIVFTVVGMWHVPVLSPIYARLLTAGISLLMYALFTVLGTGVLPCTCCCVCCSGPSAFQKTFVTSFSVGFELFLFGGMYLFFNGFWRDATVLDGNISRAIDYNSGGDIVKLLNSSFKYGLVTAVLCLVAFFFIVLSAIVAIYLLGPENFLKNVDDIALLICSVISVEFVFIGTWLSAATVYSDSYDNAFRAFLAIGAACSSVIAAIGVFKLCSCCGKCVKLVFLLRVFVYLALFVGAFFVVISVYPQRSSNKDKLNTRWNGCAPPAVSVSVSVGGSLGHSRALEVDYNNNNNNNHNAKVNAKANANTNAKVNARFLLFDAGELHHLQHLQRLTGADRDGDRDGGGGSSMRALDGDETEEGMMWEEKGQGQHGTQWYRYGYHGSRPNADTKQECSELRDNVEKVYGCNNTLITGNGNQCDDSANTTVNMLVDTADGYGLVFGFSALIIIIYLLISIANWVASFLAAKYYFVKEGDAAEKEALVKDKSKI